MIQEESININMRCIEIQCWQWQHLKADMININMRCIEIELSAVYANADCGLTLT